MYSILMTALLGAQIAFWTEPSLVNAGLDRSPFAGDTGRIYAARGESESFQLCVRARRGPLDILRIEADAPGKGIPAPHVYLALPVETETPSPRMLAKQPWIADALRPAVPVHVDEDKVAVFWLTYDIARDAEPGIRMSPLRVLADGAHTKPVEVRFEIFDFSLPEIPSLAMLFSIDKSAAPPLEAFAKELGPWRVGFGPLELAADRGALAAGLDEAHWACAEWSLSGATPFDQRDAETFLAAHGGKSRALVKMPLPDERAFWEPLRGELDRQPCPLPVLLLGPPNPFFERIADRWALPLETYSPELLRRFHQGLSLASPTLPLLSATASSSGAISSADAAETTPADACDGSVFTYWRAGKTPRRDREEWVQFRFAESVASDTIVLWWMPDATPKETGIQLSNDGAAFSPATLSWRRSYDPETDRAVDVGTFRLHQTCRALRVQIFSIADNAAPALAEVAFAPPDRLAPPVPSQSIAPWLTLDSGVFPSLAAGTHPVEARLLPWVCWSRGIAGIAGPFFNRPPRTPETPGPVKLAGCGADTLVYAANGAWTPSVRLERLRDGIEDFDYLKLASEGVRTGRVQAPGIGAVLAQPFDIAEPEAKLLDGWRKMLLDAHLKIGRELATAPRASETARK